MKKRWYRCTLMLTGLIFLVPLSLVAQKQTSKTAEEGKDGGQVAEAVTGSGVHYNSDNRRDPFLNPIVTRKKTENPDAEAPRGQQPPGIAGMYLAQVRLLGIVKGDETTAVFEGTDKRAYFLQEKDKLFDGYIKKIEADSVILIRETKLMSGKVVTQEVVKRLRTP